MWLIPSSIRSVFAPESGCLTKESELRSTISALPPEQWPMQSGKPLRPASLLLSWKRERWSQRLCGAAIFDASAQQDFAARWIASLPDSRAKTSASQESGQDLTASAPASFSTSSTLPTIAVRGASLWRTSAPSLLPPPPLWTRPKGNLKNVRPPESWENWPTAGGTRNGSLFPRPTWAPATGGQGGSASRGDGWATPDCNTSTYSNGKMGPNIREQASQWLTPNVPNGGRSVPAELVASKGGPNQAGSKGDLMLPSAAAQWPTPNTFDAVNAGTPAQYIARKLKTQATVNVITDLSLRVQQWPTPASRDHKGTDLPSRRGGASLSHATQTGVFSHSSPQDQPIQDGDESSPDGHGSALHSVLKGNTTPRLLSVRLNPYFAEWLMGWPMGWTSPSAHTDCAKLAMESFRRKQQQHLSCLFDEQGSSL